MSWTRSRTAPNLGSFVISAPPTTPGPSPTWASTPDVIIECTGVGSVIVDSIRHVDAGGVVCLTGVGSGGGPSGLSPADVGKELVLQNNVVVGSVNANRRHFYRAAQALAAADTQWLGG